MKKLLIAGTSGPEFRQVLEMVMAFSFAGTQPDKLLLQYRDAKSQGEWREVMRNAKQTGSARWRDAVDQIEFLPNSELVVFSFDDAFDELADAMKLLEPLPFELCILDTPFASAWRAASYERTGFGRSNLDHGWGCVFRGAGHDRLASRRWLDFGPWRVIRRPDDTTWIQFYDLAITDPAEAYAQAWPGHDRMGNGPIGGYIGFHDAMLIEGAVKEGGIYIRETRTIELVIPPGTQVAQGTMLAQCARRLQRRHKARQSEPVDHIAYIFLDRADAEAHLHELWLRELQCWYVDERGKHRLDSDYHPTPDPPAWVRRLDAQSP